MLTDPSGCLAGQVCSIQPSIAVISVSSGEIAYSFQGSMYVNLATSPSGYEKLLLGSSGCGLSSCGMAVTNSIATVSIVNGIASFSVSEGSVSLSSLSTSLALEFVFHDCRRWLLPEICWFDTSSSTLWSNTLR